MADIAKILARPSVVGALRSLVRGALIDGGVTDPHATRIAISFADRIREGAPVVTAIALVEAVLAANNAEWEAKYQNLNDRWVRRERQLTAIASTDDDDD